MTASTTTNKTEWLDKHTLTDRQRLFVIHYLETQNSVKAAQEAGYKQARTQGPRLLSNVGVRAAILEGREQIEEAVMIDAEGVAKMWFDLATADPTELTQNMTGACRYCHGIDSEFQWKTPREFRDARISTIYDLFDDPDLRDTAVNGMIEDERIPTDDGGYGYRITDDPNPDCPECAGLGIEHVRMADTRTLSPAAKLLYDGVEETRQGKKIRVTDRAAALERLGKSLGMFAGKVESEETNDLTRLLGRLMGNASSVPVTASQPGARAAQAQPNDHPPDQDGQQPASNASGRHIANTD